MNLFLHLRQLKEKRVMLRVHLQNGSSYDLSGYGKEFVVPRTQVLYLLKTVASYKKYLISISVREMLKGNNSAVIDIITG